MESKRLDNAALAAGISPNYINAHGKPQSIGAETKRRLLDAMHRTTAATQVAVTPVPNVMVYTAGKKMPLAVEGSGEFNWLLTTEEGVQHKGQAVGVQRAKCGNPLGGQQGTQGLGEAGFVGGHGAMVRRERSAPRAMDAPGGLASQCRPLWDLTAQQRRRPVLLWLWVTDASSVGRQPRQTIA